MNAQPHWSPIADALRAEIEEYGGLLQLFEQQQEKIFARDADGVSGITATIEAQSIVAEHRRRDREQLVRQLATNNQREATSLRQLLDLFPNDARPLFEALIDEINNLIHRIRRRGRQNNLLLSRLVEVHQRIVPGLRPHTYTKTYTRRGSVTVAASDTAAAFRANG